MSFFWKTLNWVGLVLFAVTELFGFAQGRKHGLADLMLGLIIVSPYVSALFAAREASVRWQWVTAMILNGGMAILALTAIAKGMAKGFPVQVLFLLLAMLFGWNIWIMARRLKASGLGAEA